MYDDKQLLFQIQRIILSWSSLGSVNVQIELSRAPVPDKQHYVNIILPVMSWITAKY